MCGRSSLDISLGLKRLRSSSEGTGVSSLKASPEKKLAARRSGFQHFIPVHEARTRRPYLFYETLGGNPNPDEGNVWSTQFRTKQGLDVEQHPRVVYGCRQIAKCHVIQTPKVRQQSFPRRH